MTDHFGVVSRLCAIAIGLSCASTTAHAHVPKARFEQTSCPAQVSASLDEHAVDGVRCGFVEVPESYARPRVHAARLRIFVLIAETKAQNPGAPVFFLTGGPGQSLSVLAGQVLATGAMARVLQHRDVVLIDPRGAGFSEPRLSCPPPAPPGPGAADPGGVLTPPQRDAVACADALTAQGVDLAAYNTENLVLDLKRVRAALRIPKVALYGVSYGAFLGLHALAGAEDWVESAVLTSLPHPRGGTVVRSGPSAQGALDTFAQACASQPACAAYGDFSANLNALLEQLTVEPLDLGQTSPAGVPLQLTVDFLGPAIQQAMSDPQTAAVLPKAVAQALELDGSAWVPWIAGFFAPPPIDPNLVISLPLNRSIWCAEELTIGSVEELERRAASTDPIVRRSFLGIGSAYEICEVWPVPAAAPSFYKPIRTSIPTYLIAGALDPITTPAFSRIALRHLRNGQLTVIEAASHLAAEHGCGPELVERFFNAPYRHVDDSCAATPVPFD
jgi:pimeloyl-ACP methyl ester carboxylesterase